MIRCSAARATFAPLAFIAVGSIACGGAAPPTQAPSALAKPVASAALPAAPDLSPVAAPQSLVISGRLAKPAASLATFGSWSHFPMPQADQVTEILLGEAVGPLVDLDQSVDMALAIDPARAGAGFEAIQGGLLFAFSAAVKDADAAKTVLSERFKLVPAENGALVISGLGHATHRDGDEDPDEDGDFRRTCELAPAFGAAPTRLVCALGNDKALRTLGPWLTRGATRLPSPADAHLELRMRPIKGMLADQGKMLGTLLGSMLGSSLPLPSLREVLTAYVSDLVDFLLDVDTESVDVVLSDASARATVTLALSSATSTMARITTSNADRDGPPPAAFWQMPADADGVGFGRGIDDALIARPRELLLKVADEALAQGGVKDGDRKALLDAVAKLATVPPLVYASGVDADALAKAIAAAAPEDPHAVVDVYRGWALAPLLFGWYVGEVDEPGAQLEASIKDFVAAWARPGLAAAYRSKLPGLGRPPAIRSVPLPKAASSWPKGAAHYAIEFPPLTVPPSAPKRSGAKDGKDKEHRSAPKPWVVHVLLVPDATRTWVGVSPDEVGVTAKLDAAMAGSGATLASRADLASLKSLRVGGASFFTLAGAATEIAAFGSSLQAPWHDVIGPVDDLRQAPHHGLTPILFTSAVSSPTPPSSAVVTLDVPRAAIDDLLVVIARHGGY
jgi:hypothetical protein